MGVREFRAVGTGDTVREAFADAVNTATIEHGTLGSGNVSGKGGFTEYPVPKGIKPGEFIAAVRDYDPAHQFSDTWSKHARTIARMARQHDDKWADAIAVDMGNGSWTFFGTVTS